MVGPGRVSSELSWGHLSSFHLCSFQVIPSIFPSVWQEDRPNPVEAGGPDRGHPGIWVLKSDQALMLKVRKAQLAQRIEDLVWELSLLLQVADGGTCAWGDIESHRMLRWPSVGMPSSQRT